MGGSYIGEALNAAAPLLTRPFIDKYPNSQRVRADEGLRIVWYPRDPADLNYQLLTPLMKGIIAFYATGMSPSSTVGIIETWTNLEYYPSLGY